MTKPCTVGEDPIKPCQIENVRPTVKTAEPNTLEKQNSKNGKYGFKVLNTHS
jgi:hypothetical protein